MDKTIEWIISGIIGGIAFWVFINIFIPIAKECSQGGSRPISGRWYAEIDLEFPDGKVRKENEIIIVSQLGTRIWGKTEIGKKPLHPDMLYGTQIE